MASLTTGPILKGIVGFTVPMTLANLFQQGYLLVDSFMVAKFVGTHGLAAIGAAQPVFYLMNAMFIGVATAFTIRLAHLAGARGSSQVRSVARALVLFTVTWSAICLVLAAAGAGPLFSLMGIPDEVAGEAAGYLGILALGFPAIFGVAAIGAYLRGRGDSKGAFWILGVSSLLKAGFGWLLVGPLHLGLPGAAWATVISTALAVVGGLAYTRRRHPLTVSTGGGFPREELVRALKLGAPLAAQHIALSVGIMVLVWVIQPFGASALAAFTVLGRIELFTSMVFLDLSGALAAFAAQNAGAGQHARITHALRRVALFTVAFSGLVSVVVLGFKGEIAAIFSSDLVVQELIERAIGITYPFFGVYAIMVVLHGCLNGYQRTTAPLVCTIVAFVVVQVPAAYFLGASFGITGVMWAAPIGWVVGLVYTVITTRRHFLLPSGVLPRT